MATVHISEIEAAKDFAGLMARIREGSEIVIEANSGPLAILRPVEALDPSITATLARLRKREEIRGGELLMDDDFAEAMQEIVGARGPRNIPVWD